MTYISGSINTDTKNSLVSHYMCDNRNVTLSAFLRYSKIFIKQIFHLKIRIICLL